MKKLIELFEAQEFTSRELIFMGIALLLGGTLLGVLFSPKGERAYGCNNGNNNTGYLPEKLAERKKEK